MGNQTLEDIENIFESEIAVWEEEDAFEGLLPQDTTTDEVKADETSSAEQEARADEKS